jgi:hypothetical protein
MDDTVGNRVFVSRKRVAQGQRIGVIDEVVQLYAPLFRVSWDSHRGTIITSHASVVDTDALVGQGGAREVPGADRGVGETSLLFRSVNERIRELGPVAPDRFFELVCECDDDRCAQVLQMDRYVYEALRGNPRLFILATGHERHESDVVTRTDGYVVVQGTLDRAAPWEPTIH